MESLTIFKMGNVFVTKLDSLDLIIIINES